MYHAWGTTGTASGEVYLSPALEKPDEWTKPGRRVVLWGTGLSPRTGREPLAEAAVEVLAAVCCDAAVT